MGDHYRIFRSIVIVAFFVFAGKILGALREMVLAAHYGVGETLDAFLLVSNLANWPISVCLTTLTVTLVPLLVRVERSDPGAAQQFVAELSVVSLIVGTLFAVAFALGIEFLAFSGALGPSVELARAMAWPIALSLPLGFLVASLSARLLSRERHINTLAEGVPALSVTIAVVCFPHAGISPLVWGTVIGFAAQSVVLWLFVPRAISGSIVKWQLKSPLWQPFLSGFSVFAIGHLIVASTGVVDQLMVVGVGAGSVALLGYANRILSLVLGLGATAVARATLPVFSEQTSGQSIGSMRSAKVWVGILFAVGAISVPVGWVLAPHLVQLLFERGAFTHENSVAVTYVLRLGLFQLPFYFSSIVVVQWLAATRRYDQITIVGLVNLAVKVVANFILVGSFGVGGVMISTAIMYGIALVLLWRAAFASEGRACEL